MNEKRIEQVMQIESQAEQILDAAKQDAARLPLQAEREAQDLLVQARAEAQAEAERMLAQAASQNETAQIAADAERRIHDSEEVGTRNMDRAVDYVLTKVLGKA